METIFSIITDQNYDENKHLTKGRKRLNIDDKRTNKKTTNFNNAELEIVEKLARQNELTVSDYIRQSAINGEINAYDKSVKRELVQTLGETAKALNKLTEKAHGRNGSLDKGEAAEIAELMLGMCDQLSEIRLSLYK